MYNADNEQTKFNGTSLSYDNDGNVTGDGTNTYTWDARNHLTQIAQGRTVTASFVYDGFGRRMSKAISGTTTQFLYDGFNPAQELNANNQPVANLLTGLRTDEYFTRTDTATSTFLTDALGSTIGMVGTGGTVATNYTYQPFGATTVAGSANSNTYQFTGRENDATGLYFYRARYYSSTYQRFIGQDPIEFRSRSANLYSYVFNDPVNLSDPDGRVTAQQLLDMLKQGEITMEEYEQQLIDEIASRFPDFYDEASMMASSGNVYDQAALLRLLEANEARACLSLGTAVGGAAVAGATILLTPTETGCQPGIETCAN